MFLIVALASLVSLAGFSTTPDVSYADVVLLKNGAIVKGRILTQEPGKDVRIEQSNQVVIDIPRKKIALVTTTNSDYETRHRQILDSIAAGRPVEWTFRQLQILRFGVAMGTSMVYGGSGTFGTEAFKGLYVGLSGGVERHSAGTFLPVTGELGLLLQPASPQLTLVLKAGYSLGWLDSQHGSDYGGARFGAALDFGIPVHDDVSLFAEVGYAQQQVNKPSSLISTLDLFALNLGMQFGKL